MEKFSLKRRIGNLGEDLAELFLVKRNYKIIEKNYLKKFGELDIIAKKDNIINFIEVKSLVTRESNDENVSQLVSQNGFTMNDFKIEVSRETNEDDTYLPEDNVNYWKQKRMIRTIEVYILEREIHEDQEWQIDVLGIAINKETKKAKIKHFENAIWERVY